MNLKKFLQEQAENDIAEIKKENLELKNIIYEKNMKLTQREEAIEIIYKNREELQAKVEELEKKLQGALCVAGYYKDAKKRITELESSMFELQQRIKEDIDNVDILEKQIGSLKGGLRNIRAVLYATTGASSCGYFEQEIRRALSMIDNYLN